LYHVPMASLGGIIRRLLTIVALASLFAAAAGQTMHHQRLAIGLGNVSKGILSEQGYAAFLAVGAASFYDPWVAGQPYAADWMTGERESDLYGFTATGVLLWGFRSDALAGVRHVFLGLSDLSSAVGSTTDGAGAGFDAAGNAVWRDGDALFRGTVNISEAVLGSGSTSVYAAKLDDDGGIAWVGAGTSTGGYRDVFYESTNVSQPVLGSGERFAGLAAVDEGLVLWTGWSSATGGNPDVFRGPSNVSAPALGAGPREAYGKDVVCPSTALWSGMGDTTGGHVDTFLNQTNLSTTVLGSGMDRSSAPIALASTGVPLWAGASMAATSGNFDLFVGMTNYSASILGSSRNVTGLGFTSAGVPVWAGRGSTTALRFNVFLGTKNVTQDACGQSRSSFLLAANKRGQILWRAQEADLTSTVWLSSPAKATSVSGNVKLEGLAAPVPHTVQMQFLEPATGDVLFEQAVDLGADGTYAVSIPQTGLFDVRVSAPHFISRVARGVPAFETGQASLSLPNGDANLDDAVDIQDLNDVLIRFGTAGGGDPVDLNEDGQVDLLDLLMVLLYFGELGE
jgi:hypothetical protein